ncbi:hypothetical protein DICPUDRAFT_156143 [Dictyostelium purpureum]|uniref:Uncharacterized protein n=1 Tax=Dictyostelium purpureum TaxID=5786 RepID=F0ZVU2_DICPU|nr:uncharacterized protein DICPUDRAFT_156143 [Dictyostelium purpureum]EGC31941.1 hypothetical protein DICPUDRAFT_156143 [Dictyostelium purpureum]|eukprot:XP_003291543.1 hypothetical protein DICPUDRAFT_156143 [Dictyostelium purpureum]
MQNKDETQELLTKCQIDYYNGDKDIVANLKRCQKERDKFKKDESNGMAMVSLRG